MTPTERDAAALAMHHCDSTAPGILPDQLQHLADENAALRRRVHLAEAQRDRLRSALEFCLECDDYDQLTYHVNEILNLMDE